MEEFGTAGQVTYDNIKWRIHFEYWIIKATHSEYVILLLFYDNNGYANAPQCYVIHTFHVLFQLTLRVLYSPVIFDSSDNSNMTSCKLSSDVVIINACPVMTTPLLKHFYSTYL